MKPILLAAVAASALLSASAVYAQNETTSDTPPAAAAGSDNANTLNKLEDFKSTGTMRSNPTVPQGGEKAAAIKRTLANIKLPPGFKISLYALVPDARMIAVGPQGVVTYVSTRKTKVYTLTDRGPPGVAEDVRAFAPPLPFSNPNGLCF